MKLSALIPIILAQEYENIQKVENFQDVMGYSIHLISRTLEMAQDHPERALQAVVPASIAAMYLAVIADCLEENKDASFSSIKNAILIAFHEKAHKVLEDYKKRESEGAQA